MEVLPFLKWAGGKRWLCQRYPELFLVERQRYVEPFLGGGAAFFALNPVESVVSDLNAELIETYVAIKEDWQKVLEKLQAHQRLHLKSPEYYYQVRESRPRTSVGRAAKLIYLNRTCFNGLYRVNLSGEFNVPRGTKNSVLLSSDNFQFISERLNKAKIFHADFESIINGCSGREFIFVDPPYTVKHNINGFLKYNERIFSWADQERLADALKRFALRGGKALVTNAAHSSVIKMYAEIGEVYPTSRYSVLASSSEKRNEVEEIAVTIGYKVSLDTGELRERTSQNRMHLERTKEYQRIKALAHPSAALVTSTCSE